MADRHKTLPCRWQIHSPSAEITRRLGAVLGRLAPPGTILAFGGDLGAGKTTLVQGLARGLGVCEAYYVTSPSFTLINEYPGRRTLYHVDLYRIGEHDEILEIGLEEILEGDGVVAIEWAERLEDLLPAAHLRIDLSVTGEHRRQITLSGYGESAQRLVQAVRNEWMRGH